MRILFLTPQMPYPPHQGTQIRNYHLLRAAASRHRVDLVTFIRPGEGLPRTSPLQDICGQIWTRPAPTRGQGARLMAMLTSMDPDLALRLRSDEFAETLRGVVAGDRYDAVQVAGLEMARYIPAIRAVAPTTKVILDEHNAEYRIQARAAAVDIRRLWSWHKAFYSFLQYLKLRRYEAWACRSADLVLAVSGVDAEALRSMAPAARVQVIPNGVDCSQYQATEQLGEEPPGLLFTGTMDYRPNVDAMQWFVTEILPRIRVRYPKIPLRIVGRAPTAAVKRLASATAGVTVTGAVEDVRPFFAGAPVFVAPIRIAGGARLKILEAMAMGAPTVSTRIGAEGLDLVDEEELLLADSPAEFASAVLRLLEDRALRKRIARAGRRAVLNRFDWERLAPTLLDVYNRLTTG